MPSGTACGTPVASIVTSAPRPLVSLRTRSTRSSSRPIVWSAPSVRAAWRRSSGPPITITWPAPRSCASAAAHSPTGPAPWMTTQSPKAMSASVTACSAVGIPQPPAMNARQSRVSGSGITWTPGRRWMYSLQAAEQAVVARQRDAVDLAVRAARARTGDGAEPAAPAGPVDVEERHDLALVQRVAVDVERAVGLGDAPDAHVAGDDRVRHPRELTLPQVHV